MFEEPPLIPESVFSLVDFDEELGVTGFSEEAQQRLNGCQNIYFIMATGDTGRGKSTKLSQLVNPDFKIVHNEINDGDPYVFKASGGPDPTTGFERDGMNFPSIGPLSLSGFKKRWGFPIQPEDEEIALVFVDSQGTNAPIEEARGLIISIGALTTALGLRLYLTDSGRPTFKAYNDVSGGIILNNFITRGGNLVLGYNIGVINPDVHQTSQNDEAHNEKYAELWKENNHYIANTPDFKLFMLENPYKNLEGYWDSMKDIALMISDLEL